MKLWIRPNHRDDEYQRLMSIALCTTDQHILVDSQILVHFPPDTSGNLIRQEAVETFNATEVECGRRTFTFPPAPDTFQPDTHDTRYATRKEPAHLFGTRVLFCAVI